MRFQGQNLFLSSAMLWILIKDMTVHYVRFVLLFIRFFTLSAGTLKTMQEKWPRQYGDIFHWFAGSQLNVSICSAELIEVKSLRR